MSNGAATKGQQGNLDFGGTELEEESVDMDGFGTLDGQGDMRLN